MTHSKLHRALDALEELNDYVIPGRGKLFGLNPKHDIFTPLDLVPFIGPLNKVNKGIKLLKIPKYKLLVLGAGGLVLDLFALNTGYEYLTRGKGSGAPLALPPPAPKKASKASAGNRPGWSSCPKGYRWDGKMKKCVRIRKR